LCVTRRFTRCFKRRAANMTILIFLHNNFLCGFNSESRTSWPFNGHIKTAQQRTTSNTVIGVLAVDGSYCTLVQRGIIVQTGWQRSRPVPSSLYQTSRAQPLGGSPNFLEDSQLLTQRFCRGSTIKPAE